MADLRTVTGKDKVILNISYLRRIEKVSSVRDMSQTENNVELMALVDLFRFMRHVRVLL